MEAMPLSLLHEWMAFDLIEPLDTAYRVEVALARISALLVDMVNAIHGKKGERPPPAKITDYLSDWSSVLFDREPGPKKQSVSEMKSLFLKIAKGQSQGGKSIKRK